MAETPRLPYRLLDGVGVGMSMLCLVHCLALPLLVAALPLIAASVVTSESFHVWMLVAIVPTSVLALGSGFRKHRQAMLFLPGVAGLCLIAAGAFGPALIGMPPWLDTALTVFGGLLLATAHVLNYLLLQAGRRHAACAH